MTLETLAAHVDRICQMAGDVRHVGLGSDFDGGFGLSCRTCRGGYHCRPAETRSRAGRQRV